MGLLETFLSWFSNPLFYIILIALTLFAWGSISAIFRHLPVVNNKRTLMYAAIFGLLLTSGVFGGLGIGSFATTSTTATVTDLQVTTSFSNDFGATLSEDTMLPDVLQIRLTDVQANESNGLEEVASGIITVTRSGKLDADSVPVTASFQTYNSEKTPTSGTTYTVVERNAMGEPYVYLNSGAAATVNSSKGRTAINFAEGASTGTLGVAINVDEEGHDELAQYSYRDVVVMIGDMPYTFRITRMD